MRTPVWVPVTGAILGGFGAVIAGQSILIDGRTGGDVTAETVTDLLASPWVPCAKRIPMIVAAVQQLPSERSVPAVYAAADLDPRCDTITNYQAEIALQLDQLDIADRATSDAITFNPNSSVSWLLRSQYHLKIGDLAAAEADYAIAVELSERIPGNDNALTSLEQLRQELDAAVRG